MTESREFQLHVDMDNAAFEDNREGELSRILRKAADQIEDGMLDPWGQQVSLRDINGNTVGAFKVKIYD